METNPDYVVADAGSPTPGLSISAKTRMGHFAREELELLLTASRKKGIPLYVGSAGDTGTNAGVDEFVVIIKELASSTGFRSSRSDTSIPKCSKEFLKRKLKRWQATAGLGGFRAPDRRGNRQDYARRCGRGVGPVHEASGYGRGRHHRRPLR